MNRIRHHIRSWKLWGFAVAYVCLFSLPGQAQLAWEQTEASMEQVGPLYETVASFKFTNAGDYPLRILKVRCSDPNANASVAGRGKTIRPGESGVIRIAFVGRRVFDERVISASVVTDERSAPQGLTLRVMPDGWQDMSAEDRDELRAWGQKVMEIPAVLGSERTRIAWNLRGGKAPETADLVFETDAEAVVVAPELRLLVGEPAWFEAAIKEGKSDRSYAVQIEPAAEKAEVRLRRSVWHVDWGLDEQATARLEAEGLHLVKAVAVDR